MIGMWKMETVKLVRRKRWLTIIPAFLLASLLRIDSISAYEQLDVNVWDGIFGTFFHYVYFRFIILLLFVFLATDSISGDISSKWTYLTLSRCSNRSQWWLSKVASIYTAALIYSTVGVLIVFLVSLTQLPYGGTLSAFATNPPDLFKAIGTYVIPKNMSPFVLTGQLILYTSFALGTFCLIPVFLSMIIPKTHIGPTVSLVWIFVSQFFQNNHVYMRLDIMPRLLYGAFFYPDALVSFSLNSSLVYLLIVAVGFSCAGVYLVRKADF
ncbi:MAG TPA: hypothetical protein PKU68_05340 [Bacillota bacterium]|nr:hypothetical protein [Bacillota bacterium]